MMTLKKCTLYIETLDKYKKGYNDSEGVGISLAYYTFLGRSVVENLL